MRQYEIEVRGVNKDTRRTSINRIKFEAETDREAVKTFQRTALASRESDVTLWRIDDNKTRRLRERKAQK